MEAEATGRIASPLPIDCGEPNFFVGLGPKFMGGQDWAILEVLAQRLNMETTGWLEAGWLMTWNL